MSDITTLYHSQCSDGIAAAAVVELYARTINKTHSSHPVQYRGALPIDIVGDVFIVDFSFPLEVLEEIRNRPEVNSLTLLDHHKTALHLTDVDYCTIDMTKSGATLTWSYLFPDTPVPEFLSYIQDRDLWTWELPDSEEFHAGLSGEIKNVVKWADWLEFPEMYLEKKQELLSTGKILRAYQRSVTMSVVGKEHRIVEIAGFKVPYVNNTHLTSEVGGELAKGYPFSVTWFETQDSRIHSLRSSPDGIDVSLIAKQFGGGGHEKAAGYTLLLKEDHALIAEHSRPV